MKDILEIRLDEKAGDDLRLIGHFETGLVVEERDGRGVKSADVESAFSRLRRDSSIGSRCPKRIIGPRVPKSNEIDARVGIEINAVAIGWSRGGSRENPHALFWVVSRQAPNHLIDQAIDPRIAAMHERIASAQWIGEQQAIGADKLIAEVPEMMPYAKLDRSSKASRVYRLIISELRLANQEGRVLELEYLSSEGSLICPNPVNPAPEGSPLNKAARRVV